VVRALVTLAVAISWLVGCVSLPPLIPSHLPQESMDPIELEDIPFFPQRKYQCGPAALATILVASGADTSAEQLTSDVYLPGRRGSLQLELVAAVRRYGFVPYTPGEELRELLAQIDDGRPVLVLLNLGLTIYPMWHYAVVVGYSPLDDTLILRSGTKKRRVIPARRFLRQWQGSDHWSLLVLRPGELPAHANPDELVKAAAALEATGNLHNARVTYLTVTERWPDHADAQLGLGNTLYGLGEKESAEDALRALLARHPDHAAARNNLAHILMERGCVNEARELIDAVLADDQVTGLIRTFATETREALSRLTASADPVACSDGGSL
jgi:tetratricopeptide (TPR) repeat protein